MLIYFQISSIIENKLKTLTLILGLNFARKEGLRKEGKKLLVAELNSGIC